MPKYVLRHYRFDRVCDTLSILTIWGSLLSLAFSIVMWLTALPFIGLMYLMGVLR